MKVGYGELRLHCTSSDCDVSTSEETPEAYAAFRQLVAIITPRVNRFAATLLSGWFYGVYFALFVAVSLIAIITGNSKVSWVSIVLPAVIWLNLFWQLGMWDRRKSVVILQYRRDAPTYWEENRGKILTGIIATSVSGILLLMAVRVVTGAWPDRTP